MSLLGPKSDLSRKGPKSELFAKLADSNHRPCGHHSRRREIMAIHIPEELHTYDYGLTDPATGAILPPVELEETRPDSAMRWQFLMPGNWDARWLWSLVLLAPLAFHAYIGERVRYYKTTERINLMMSDGNTVTGTQMMKYPAAHLSDYWWGYATAYVAIIAVALLAVAMVKVSHMGKAIALAILVLAGAIGFGAALTGADLKSHRAYWTGFVGGALGPIAMATLAVTLGAYVYTWWKRK